MGRFSRTVRRISRSRSDDAGGHGQKSVNGGDCITEAVEEQDVVHVNLSTTQLVVFLYQEFAGFKHTLGRTITVTTVCLCQVDHNILNPVRNLTFLFDGVTNVFPVNGEAECLELVCLLYDFTDFVREFLGTFAQ